MTPTSEQLEAFFERLRALDRDLAKLKGAEVTNGKTIAAIKTISKEWLRFSEGLRAIEALPKENLDSIDSPLKEMFEGTRRPPVLSSSCVWSPDATVPDF